MAEKRMRRLWQVHLSTILLASIIAGGILFANLRMKFWHGNKGEYAINNDFAGRGWPLVIEQYVVSVIPDSEIEKQYQPYQSKQTLADFRSGVVKGMIGEAGEQYQRTYRIYDMPGTGVLILKVQMREVSYQSLIADIVVGLTIILVFVVGFEFFLRRRPKVELNTEHRTSP